MSSQDHRALCLFDQFDSSLQVFSWCSHRGFVTRKSNFIRVFKFGHFHLGVFAEVDQHRTGSAAAGDVERLTHNLGDLIRAGNKVVVLRYGQSNTGHIHFLESIPADQVCRYLSCYTNYGR